MRKEIALVGCGMGTPGSLTVEGKCRIEEAEVLIGPERLIKPYSDSKKEIWVQYRAEQIRGMLFEDMSYIENLCFLLGEKTQGIWSDRGLRKKKMQCIYAITTMEI